MDLLIKFLCVLCVRWTDAELDEIVNRKPDAKVTKQADGIEFSNISRSTLLQILSTIEEQMRIDQPLKRVLPTFKAQFANNKFTKPFIYKMPDTTEMETLYPDPGIWSKTSMIQILYGLLTNLTPITVGLAYGFSNIIITQTGVLKLSFTPSVGEASFIISVLALATAAGSLFSGYFEDALGRRLMFTMCEVPLVAGWIFTSLASSNTDLLISRILLGIGCGMAMGAPRAYLTEITLPNMRGVLGSWTSIAISIGLTIEAALGSVLKWQALSYVNGIYSIILFFVSFMFPETPYFVLMNDTPENTLKALKKFRAANYDVEAELDQMLEYKFDNQIHKSTFKERVMMLFSRAACKPLWIVTIYIIFAQLTGTTVILMWASDMINVSHSSIQGSTSGILLGFTRIFTGIVVSILLLNYGRRPLALASSIGMSISTLVLGVYLTYTKETSIFPMLCYMVYLAFAVLGYITLPILIMFELAPLQIRGLLGSITLFFLNMSVFIINESYLYVQYAMGFPNVILSFGISAFIGSIYIYYFLPETKDLTLQEIEEYYNERRPTLTSQRRIVSMQALSGRNLTDAQSKSLIRIKRFE